ncbi:MAG TPA: hypothetical protein VFA11_12135 [Acidimicrobiales bacterium]|nr:hypothetical protein [Acidimicrobiales bacterium]
MNVLGVGFPNPLGWVADALGGAASGGVHLIFAGLTSWVLQSLEWVVGGVFNFFIHGVDPDVSAPWFSGGGGPYLTMAGIGGLLMVGFLLIGITQGALAGDVGGMARRIGVEAPMAVLGMVGLVGATQVLIRLTDGLSQGLLGQFAKDVHSFTATVGTLAGLGGGAVGGLVVLLLALVSVLAGIVLVAELVIRAALIYIVVALAPLVFAAALWPALRSTARKTIELLGALILSKLVVAVALVVAAAAAAHAGGPSAISTALATPDGAGGGAGGGGVANTVGVLLAAAAAFGVAAFSPLLVARLLPLTEGAMVASGIRGGPARAGQQALSASYYTRTVGRSRLSSLASGAPGGTPTAGAGGTTAGAAGGAAASAAGAGAAAAGGAARTGTRAATAPVAERSRGPTGRPGGPGTGRRPPSAPEDPDAR